MLIQRIRDQVIIIRSFSHPFGCFVAVLMIWFKGQDILMNAGIQGVPIEWNELMHPGNGHKHCRTWEIFLKLNILFLDIYSFRIYGILVHWFSRTH